MNTLVERRADKRLGALWLALDAQADALDGYPVAALVDDWPGTEVEVAAILQQVLTHWLARLDHDLADMPNPPNPVLLGMKYRMQETRHAIEDLLGLAQRAAPQMPGPVDVLHARSH